MPGGNLANTRAVTSAITSSDVSKLGVAWCVPVESTGASRAAGLTDGYATTPVVVGGVVYTQDQESNVMAIELATGKVLWAHDFNSANGGPDGVNVVGGTVYAATDSAAVALSAATGKQLWSRTLIGNDLEGIDMAPGYNDGTVYVSTVPINPAKGQYLGGAKSTLWALNAATGAPQWAWDEVQDLWGHPGLNSGGGLWDPPSFDAQGNLYIGIANPGPIGQDGWPNGYPWVTSRPAPDLYTDSVVKLSPHGKLLWQLPVGVHAGPANAGLITENATPASAVALPSAFSLEPGVFGGVESQLATNGSTTFAAVNNLAVPMSVTGVTESSKAFQASIPKATGEMVAVNQDTGKVEWNDKLPSSPYGAAAVTNNVVFTTTYSGHLYAFNATTGAVLLNTPMPAGSNAPVTIDGDYVISGAAVPLSGRSLIIAYKLGATGKLPDTVH